MTPHKRPPLQCQVCREQPVKYKCPSCPVRYCSVKCYKKHKAQTCRSTAPSPTEQVLNSPTKAEVRCPLGDTASTKAGPSSPPVVKISQRKDIVSLKPLTEVRWPPEPDPSIFDDPLLREDPKPLRREELMRIATSPQLRNLLSTPAIPHILRILDALSTTLSRLLSIDETSLSTPGGGAFLTESSSPPPLHELLASMNGEEKHSVQVGTDNDGWFLGSERSAEGRIWVGQEERRMMRLWAGVVCDAIDGKGGGEVGWGDGALAWEV